MKKQKETTAIDFSTEEKIKNAAKLIFHKKGFASTRTRDIAEEAGINLALLNYYFRSKEKLFELIMQETMHGFVQSLKVIFENDNITLEQKIELLANNYIDFLGKNPDMPLFVLGEMRRNPAMMMGKMGLKSMIMNSHFMKQLLQGVEEGTLRPIKPLHFLMNLVGMTIFPFLAAPIVKGMGDLSDENFAALMQERKALIPIWIKAILNVKQ